MGDPRLLFLLGVSSARLGLYDRAEKAFNNALALLPGNFDILFNLGRAAARAQHYDRAERALEAALKIRPGDVDLLLELGRVCAARQNYARAVFVLAQARQQAPGTCRYPADAGSRDLRRELFRGCGEYLRRVSKAPSERRYRPQGPRPRLRFDRNTAGTGAPGTRLVSRKAPGRSTRALRLRPDVLEIRAGRIARSLDAGCAPRPAIGFDSVLARLDAAAAWPDDRITVGSRGSQPPGAGQCPHPRSDGSGPPGLGAAGRSGESAAPSAGQSARTIPKSCCTWAAP